VFNKYSIFLGGFGLLGVLGFGALAWRPAKIPPTRNGARVHSIDDSAAKNVKGYIRSLVLDDPSDTVVGWVLVFASSYPAVIRAADLVKVDWLAGDGAKV
jgi:isoquinoline 1-oxidoreductase subunit beta